MCEKSNVVGQKILLLMGLVMLYATVTVILPFELQYIMNKETVIAFTFAYLPWACWFYNNTFSEK